VNRPFAPSYVELDGHDCRIVDVKTHVGAFSAAAFGRMPYSSRVFAENLLRCCDSALLPAALEQVVLRRRDMDFAFHPARVVLQDLLGTPALVDLAGLRDAIAESGGDANRVNPEVPTQLVVDHSLNVNVDGMNADAMSRNMQIEARNNAERFEFLAWARLAFANLEIVMPGNGILHQINLERLSPVVAQKAGIAFADTLVGTDSHTTMIDALGVLGWGVGGIEAESVMLGRPIWMRLPEIVGVELIGRRQPGVQATDLVLAITEYLRGQGVVNSILEFYGEGVATLLLADRATISNMAPEFGATAAMFAIDDRTLDFLRLTGRRPAQIRLVEAYARAQGLWVEADSGAEYDRRLRFDLSSAKRALAGPSNPHDRIPLDALMERGVAQAPGVRDEVIADGPLPDGAVVLAAITSCTNTSNPRNLIAAGLVARKAVERGLQRKPWVKTSFAPGSKAVEMYMNSASLMAPLQTLGFGIVGFGCTSCNGMSGPLPHAVEQDILDRKLHTVAVLSGNRNFNGRIHPSVKESFLASPALVVAYAIAGSVRIDLENESLATDKNGSPVMLGELWPSDGEIDRLVAAHVRPEHFNAVYNEMFAPGSSKDTAVPVPTRFPWRDDSTYIRRPPYWQPALTQPLRGNSMRALAMLGDNITTDDLSPSGAILPESAAGQYLIAQGVDPADFNSYGTRRGDHLVAVRATLANNRLKNEMTPGIEGSFTRLEPQGSVIPLYKAAEVYLERGQELVMIAGKNYGCGSSRDWAAKGIRLLGVRAVICESFERIHRANLVGMGVLPLEFEPGTTRLSLALDGSELYTIEGLPASPELLGTLMLAITRRSGECVRVPVKCRIDTTYEYEVFTAGGLLQHIGNEFRLKA
jgi:2-methylcitrate dehydratase (2-methyl-trans-aconitate forming)